MVCGIFDSSCLKYNSAIANFDTKTLLFILFKVALRSAFSRPHATDFNTHVIPEMGVDVLFFFNL